MEEDALQEAYNARVEQVTHPDRKKVLRDAFKLVATARNSDFLKIILETSLGDDATTKPVMTVERAKRLLELNPEDQPDEGMLCIMFDMAVEATPGQKEALKEALGVLSEGKRSGEIEKRLGVVAGAGKTGELREEMEGSEERELTRAIHLNRRRMASRPYGRHRHPRRTHQHRQHLLPQLAPSSEPSLTARRRALS